MKHDGTTVRDIRLSKNYSQFDVSNGALHQASYSKFELGRIELTHQKFKKILDSLEMNLDEFMYVHHNYEFPTREKIIHLFEHQKFIEVSALNQIISLAENYLTNHKDRYIEDILHISRGLILIKNEGSFEPAMSYASKIWDRLQQADTWYLTDFKLIAVILFLFPVSTAISITKFALEQSEKYENYTDYKKRFIPFKFNLVMLLMKEEMFDEAYSLNEETLEELKEQKAYAQIAVSYLRKGIIGQILSKSESDVFIQKAFEIARVMEDEHLTHQLEEENDSWGRIS
ncbi:helix-turn-helix domain-containing protein [Jeotgalibacillus sp. R-1-5s-1]|uniref:helix-turn-helix domain-containing protein n=1 Tax=Jeotgalibacillus sp. R-1-5s-1 TaxID=2555897 RepID=UPI00106C92D9|nr:Rgg/GadR/MutR family transcriptional regulator [Jeotgalibacillus sp. R-1-5s-1]TFD94346.1 Rgg/GadR/MutR family transcriptional regulator [Jeotgalibacillus sp. R-1-5s-1]